MRIGKRGFEAGFKGNLHVEFGDENLTSYAGLEAVRRYVNRHLRPRLAQWQRGNKQTGDLRLMPMVLLLVALLLVGGRRLRHVSWLDGDSVVKRFAGLKRLPSSRSLSRRLASMRKAQLDGLEELMVSVASDAIVPAKLARLTLDIDGSVLTTGMKVKGAIRGYNPHNRKNPSYYPLTMMLAQTGHVVAHKNRPGNVHDSNGSVELLRTAVKRLRKNFHHQGVIELRGDSAFFRDDFIKTCTRLGVEYAIRVPFWSWLSMRTRLKDLGENGWQNVCKRTGVQGLWLDLPVQRWGRTVRVTVFRTHRASKPSKGQLDLFEPDDGFWEHSAIATNKNLGLNALWNFMNGRGVQEKTIGELKSGLAYDEIPTADFRANTAWQKLNLLTHNLQTSFQIQAMPVRRAPTRKRTTSFLVRSIRTLRFQFISRAGRIVNRAGISILRLQRCPTAEAVFRQAQDTLRAA